MNRDARGPLCHLFSPVGLPGKPQRNPEKVVRSGCPRPYVPVSGGKGLGAVTVPLPCWAGPRACGLLPLLVGQGTGLSCAGSRGSQNSKGVRPACTPCPLLIAAGSFHYFKKEKRGKKKHKSDVSPGLVARSPALGGLGRGAGVGKLGGQEAGRGGMSPRLKLRARSHVWLGHPQPPWGSIVCNR